MKTLYEHADILALNGDKFEVIKNGYLGIDDSFIDYVGEATPAAEYEEKRNFSGKLLMPGLINAHTHSSMTLLRGLGSDLPLQSWLFDYMFPTEDRLRPRDIKAGTELALLEMLSTGTTSFTDMYFFPATAIEACLSAGMRANICRPVQCFNPDEKPEENVRMRESFELYRNFHHAGEDLIRVDFCIHGEYTCTEPVVRAYSEKCAELEGRMHIHMSETKSEHQGCIEKYGCTPAEWFAKNHTFDTPTSAAHCVWVTPEDMAIMREYGVTAVHNPASNLKLGSGIAPVESMRAAGINVALGTDGAASNNNLNMFEELKLASLIHNGAMLDPTVMKPDYTLRMATAGGAAAQGRNDTGALAPGYRADIVAVDMTRPNLYPAPNIPAALCYSAQGADVYMTMVNGRVLYENGEFLTIDAERVMYDAAESVKYLGI